MVSMIKACSRQDQRGEMVVSGKATMILPSRDNGINPLEKRLLVEYDFEIM